MEEKDFYTYEDMKEDFKEIREGFEVIRECGKLMERLKKIGNN